MDILSYIVVLLLEIGFCIGQPHQDITKFDFRDSSVFDAPLNNYNRRSLRTPKIVDVYTNHPNIKEVEDNFYTFYTRKSPQNVKRHKQHVEQDPDSILDRKDTFNFQNFQNLFSTSKYDLLESDYGDFESPPDQDKTKFGQKDPSERNTYLYPQRPSFFTQKDDVKKLHDKEDDNFVFLQSQAIIPDSENYGSFYVPSNPASDPDPDARPYFWTKRENFSLTESASNLAPVTIRPYSYDQRMPGGFTNKERISTTTTINPTSIESNSNRYEEVDLAHGTMMDKPNNNGSRKQMNDMMRKYLAKLLIEKYGPKKGNKTRPHAEKANRKYSGTQNALFEKNPKTENQNSKFLDTYSLWDLKNKTVTKIKQLFSLFTIIKFNNTECNATNWAGTWQGVCLTPSECTDWNGTALGNCASGFGVCCVFRGSCGDSSSMNCSYFKSPNYPDFYPSNGGVITPTTSEAPVLVPTPDPRLYWSYYNKGWNDADKDIDNLMTGRQSASDTVSCVFRVYKTNPNVQQIRIDFIDLDLAGPTNGTCTNERLVITGQNSNDQIPVICGYSTGQHVYVDVSQLNGPLQIMVLSATGARKKFKLKICQYTDSCGTSQSNCLQYYTGTSGIIQSFNYDQAAMFNRSLPGYFNNLNYAICIRREAGYCSITYSNVRSGQMYPFQMVNILPNGQSTVPRGQAGVDVLNCPDDYIIIDGTRLCGDRFNDGSTITNFSMNAPVVDTSTGPIVINVRTNNNVTGLGFKLFYMQNPCPIN